MHELDTEHEIIIPACKLLQSVDKISIYLHVDDYHINITFPLEVFDNN